MNDLRKEFATPKFRKHLPSKCGSECVNCGGKDGIEYHHIVPIEVGGTNRYSNIVPLCITCHMAIHTGNIVKAARIAKNKMNSGRKRSCPVGYKKILTDYVECRASKSECADRLGFTTRNFTDTVWYREYREEFSIESNRNNIDVILSKARELRHGQKLGYIKYKDGRIRTFYWSRDGVTETDPRRIEFVEPPASRYYKIVL